MSGCRDFSEHVLDPPVHDEVIMLWPAYANPKLMANLDYT